MDRAVSAQRWWRLLHKATAVWLVAFASIIVLFARVPVRSQSSQRPTITVAATISAEPATYAELLISVGPSEAVPLKSFLRLRGVPPTIALSEGYSIAPGTWAVALAALPDLKLIVPDAISGRSDIVVTLVGEDGTVLAESKASLIVAAPHQDIAAPPPTASAPWAGTRPPLETTLPDANPSTANHPKTPQDLERAQRLLIKGNKELQDGNVADARLFFRRAADAGLAQAALALAATYDAAELAKLKALGIPADPTEARRWYERARQLGGSETEQRLPQLGKR